MTDPTLEHHIAQLEALFLRWDARESVGNEIIQALNGDDIDDPHNGFKTLRTLLTALRDREAECERLKDEKDGLKAAFHLVADRVETAEAKLNTLVEGLDRIIHHEVPAIPLATGKVDVAFNLTQFAMRLRTAVDAAVKGEGKP